MMQGHQVSRAVLVVDETGAAVVAALDEVECVARKYDARRTWHAAIDATQALPLRH